MLYPINPFVRLACTLIDLYIDVLIAWLILSMAISFGIANRHHPIVQRIDYALFRLTDPLLKPIRKYMPDLRGIDISPIVLILLLNFLSQALVYYLR